jgi:hypothetical protein
MSEEQIIDLREQPLPHLDDTSPEGLDGFRSVLEIAAPIRDE